MKTINYFLSMIKVDEELKSIINNSEYVKRDYKTRVVKRNGLRKLKTRETYALENFWNSLDGIYFRTTVESKYKLELLNTREIGKLKTALHLYIGEVLEHERKRY